MSSVSGSSSVSKPSRILNEGTCVVGHLARHEGVEPPWEMADLFQYHFEAIADVVMEAPAGSYAVMAVHGNRVRQTFGFVGSQALIIGRHERATIRLPEDPSVALRHLVARTEISAGKTTLRLLDLRSGQGFVIEGSDVVHEAVTTDGPIFVRLGGYTLFLMPAVSSIDWATAELAWASIPATKLNDIQTIGQDQPLPSLIVEREVTNVVFFEGPAELEKQSTSLADDEDLSLSAFAKMEVQQDGETFVYPLSLEMLQRGILIGRYDRCQVGQGSGETVSRVHALLLVDAGGQIQLIDTASHNGTTVDGEPVAQSVLGDHHVITLAETISIEWRVLMTSPSSMFTDDGEYLN